MMRLFFILIAFLIVSPAIMAGNDAKEKFKSIGDLSKTKSLSLKLTGLGGHTGECINMAIGNLTSDTLFMKLEAGRRFVSRDTTEQDIFIVKEQLITLLPRENKNLKAYGFCCEATMRSPKLNSSFSVGFMAPEPWVKLAQFLNKNSVDENAMQHAVWVMSNDHQISTVECTNKVMNEKLRKFLADLKKVNAPWYTLKYEDIPGQVFSDKHIMVSGPVEFTLRERATVAIQVRNAYDEIVAIPVPANSYANGEQVYGLDLNVKNWPKGKYTVYVFADGMRRVNKKEFVL